jgi:hypothetical protein
MKVGDLVKVRTKYRGTQLGVIIRITRDDHAVGILVQPVDGSRQMYPHHSDVEVISASR